MEELIEKYTNELASIMRIPDDWIDSDVDDWKASIGILIRKMIIEAKSLNLL